MRRELDVMSCRGGKKGSDCQQAGRSEAHNGDVAIEQSWLFCLYAVNLLPDPRRYWRS
jgi:hypothetical protein